MLEKFNFRFSQDAKDALLKAERIAISLKEKINSIHLLLSILTIKDSLAYETLEEVGITLNSINSLLLKSSPVQENLIGMPSQELKELLKQSFSLAFKTKTSQVNTLHLLLAILQNPRFLAYEILKKAYVNIDELKKLLFKQLENSSLGDLKQKGEYSFEEGQPFFDLEDTMFPDLSNFFLFDDFMKTKEEATNTYSKTPMLDLFSTDLVKKAKNNELDPLVGREKEIQRVIQILNRRKKNNPVLIGEPGVGKTAIVEGLAQLIAEGNVPLNLADKRILSLDLGLLVAGTKYRGEFEKRIKKIVEEIQKDKNIILFIDEIHTVIGAGAAEGSIDAANIIKPPLARGELRLIGATTLDEYKKHIEKDAAFERRLQPVLIEEPSSEETLKILEGVKSRYENFHKVKITKEALEAAVEFGKKYIPDRYFPDKAIDLIDEAASAKGVELQTKKINRRIISLKNKLNKIRKEKEIAVKKQDFSKAAILKDREDELKAQILKIKSQEEENKFLGFVKRKDVAKVVSLWTGISPTDLAMEEKIKYQKMEEEMNRKIIGQEKAIKELTKAIKRSSTGIRAEERPIGSFIFLGPTGVGKTETAKVLAEVLFGSKDALVKIDMSEFAEKHNVSRLVGAPPGYVGYEEGGKLTEQIRRKPYSVILFDEIEKAHPDFFNILLQVLEDGYLTDAQGRRVNFKNTVIILTSNLGIREFNKKAKIGFKLQSLEKQNKEEFIKDFASAKKRIIEKVKEFFPPEFINRIDKIIVFNPLTLEDVKKIVTIQVEELKRRLKKRRIHFEIDKEVLEFLAKRGFSPEYGARPIRRLIAKEIEDRISEGIISGEIKENSHLYFKKVDDKNIELEILDKKARV